MVFAALELIVVTPSLEYHTSQNIPLRVQLTSVSCAWLPILPTRTANQSSWRTLPLAIMEAPKDPLPISSLLG